MKVSQWLYYIWWNDYADMISFDDLRWYGIDIVVMILITWQSIIINMIMQLVYV